MSRRQSFDVHRQARRNDETKSDADKSDEYLDESDSNPRYSGTPKKRLRRRGSAPNFDSQESDDLNDSKITHPRRKSGKNFRREHLQYSMESSGRPVSKVKKKSQTKRAKKSAEVNEDLGNSHEITNRRTRGDDDDEVGGKPRRKKKKLHAEGTIELPITEILRRAQESQKNQSRYEEPIKLPELTTDTMYVQGRNGFSAVKIPTCKDLPYVKKNEWTPIEVAITAQSLSKAFTHYCQGTLAGLALSQIILVNKILVDQVSAARIFSTNYPFVVSGLFSFLGTMCLLGALDKVDLAHLDVRHVRDVLCTHLTMILTVPLYAAAICIHLATINEDNKLSSATEDADKFQAEFEDYSSQRDTNTWKSVLAIVAWLCVNLGPVGDMTLIHLKAMRKYAE